MARRGLGRDTLTGSRPLPFRRRLLCDWRSVVLTIGLAGLPISGQAPATPQWSRFRGPNGSGVSDRDKPPTTFGPTTNRIWQSPAPSGHSSPTVWSDLVFLTGVEDNGLVWRRTGAAMERGSGSSARRRRAWRRSTRSAARPPPRRPPTASACMRTSARYGLLAYDFAGKEIWRKPLPAPPTQYRIRYVADRLRRQGHPPARWQRRPLRADGLRPADRRRDLAHGATVAA